MKPLAAVPPPIPKPEPEPIHPSVAFVMFAVMRIAQLEAENASMESENRKLLRAIHRDAGGMDERAPNDGKRSVTGSASWAALRESRRK